MQEPPLLDTFDEHSLHRMGFLKFDEKWMRKREKVNDDGPFMAANTSQGPTFNQSKTAHPYFRLDLEQMKELEIL